MKTKKCENQCPKCGSLRVAWGGKVFGCYAEYQPGVCKDCGCDFQEIYKNIRYKYSETEYEG